MAAISHFTFVALYVHVCDLQPRLILMAAQCQRGSFFQPYNVYLFSKYNSAVCPEGLMPVGSILLFVVTDQQRPSCLMCGTGSSAAEFLSGFFLLHFLMFVVSQWMPPNNFPSTPHSALIAGHKGLGSIRRCAGQTSKHKVIGTFTPHTPIYKSQAFPPSVSRLR